MLIWKTYNSNNKGFTLLETIVVVFVIGLMVSIIVPVFFKQNKSLEVKKSIAELVQNTKIKAMGIDGVDIYEQIDKRQLYKGIAFFRNKLYAVEWNIEEKKWKQIVNIETVDMSDINLQITVQGLRVAKNQLSLIPFMIFKNDSTPSVVLYNNGQPYVRITSMGDVSYEK